MCYLWPCNLAVFNAWQSLHTQWRVGMDGKTGLDYAAVSAYLRDALAVKPKDRPEYFKGLQAMEAATLKVWSER